MKWQGNPFLTDYEDTMKITYADTSLAQSKADALIFFASEDFAFNAEMQKVADAFFPMLKDFLENEEFKGKSGQYIVVPVASGKKNRLIIFAGLGKGKNNKSIEFETYRRAIGSAVKTVQSKKLDTAAIQLPAAHFFDVTDQYLAEQTTIIIKMALYAFDEFFSEESSKVKKEIDFQLHADSSKKDAVERGIKRGEIIAHSVNRARHWIDLPPSNLHPVELTKKAHEIAHKYGLKFTEFSEPEIIQMGMGGLAGVGAGSHHDAKLAIIEYHCGKKDAPTLGFVGKGITFDSGGLSIKPAQSMETMKEDMSGAAAVIASIEALAQLKPDVNIIGITPLAENMPSGTATKPGDIVRFYNGKTAEVKNTDAEGRLILADALAYLVKHYKPDFIIDLATLTGACAYALGPFFSGMMSKHEKEAQKVREAGHRAGDEVWPLPFTDDYKKAIKSTAADICNIGSSKIKAGAITAGFFLSYFVDETPWVHLDIAGTAYDVPGISYYGPGATGVGVRLLVDLAENWNK